MRLPKYARVDCSNKNVVNNFEQNQNLRNFQNFPVDNILLTTCCWLQEMTKIQIKIEFFIFPRTGLNLFENKNH